MLEKANFSSVVCRELGIETQEPNLSEWTEMVEHIKNHTGNVTIGLVENMWDCTMPTFL